MLWAGRLPHATTLDKRSAQPSNLPSPERESEFQSDLMSIEQVRSGSIVVALKRPAILEYLKNILEKRSSYT